MEFAMGKFAIDFSKDSPIYRLQQDEVSRMTFVVADEPAKKDGFFQKSLCYASYYMMTFTAFCVFTPHKVAYAAEIIKHTIPG